MVVDPGQPWLIEDPIGHHNILLESERRRMYISRDARVAPRILYGMGSTRQAISQHVDVLERAGLVKTERGGRYKFHHLDTAPLRQIAERWPIPNPKG